MNENNVVKSIGSHTSRHIFSATVLACSQEISYSPMDYPSPVPSVLK